MNLIGVLIYRMRVYKSLKFDVDPFAKEDLIFRSSRSSYCQV